MNVTLVLMNTLNSTPTLEVYLPPDLAYSLESGDELVLPASKLPESWSNFTALHVVSRTFEVDGAYVEATFKVHCVETGPHVQRRLT